MANSHTPTLPHSHTQNALIVFAKPPVAGRVKTRLTELLTEREAAALYEAFLRDALAQYLHFDADVRLYVAGATEPLAAPVVPTAVSVFRQCGDGLGARMARAFRETFDAGYGRIVIIGTDHPTLPSGYLEAASEALEQPGADSIGPSADGGYYLLGMNRWYPQLFEAMTYSHAEVFVRTHARIRKVGVQPAVLPPWYDVDRPEDLQRLAADLADRSNRAPHTRRRLKALTQKYRCLGPDVPKVP